jgi:hypothetical protein
MGSAGQVLTSAGVGLPTYWTTPSGGGGGGGTVTNVTGTSPVTVTSPSTTPNISLTTIPTTLGGTGLTTIGTNGQVLSSNGTTLQYITLPTPVTSVSATSPLASSGGATPTISIASSTGTGSVVLQTSPQILTLVEVRNPAASSEALLIAAAGDPGTTGTINQSTLSLRTIGLGGGWISQNIFGTYSAANGYHISINSVDRVVIPSGPLCIPNGIVQAIDEPMVITTNTAYTIIRTYGGVGMYGFKGASNNQLDLRFASVSTFGTPNVGMTLTSGGNVGIGTTTPAYDLDINKPIGSAISFAVRDNYVAGFRTQWNYSGGQGETDFWNYRGGGSGGFWFKNLNTGNADVGFASIHCGSIYSDGRVGIGTTAPTQKLHVLSDQLGDSMRVENSRADSYTTINFKSTTQEGAFGIGGSTAAQTFLQNKFYWYYGGATRMVIDTTGNVGIGTTAPDQKLHINNGRLRISDTSDAVIEVFTASYSNYLYTKSSDGHFIFDVSTRNVGIGTTTPSSKLHVAGTTRATNFTTNGTNTFTYASGTFTPRIAMFYTSDNKVYECNNPPAGKDPIAISYSVQTGVWVRVGNLITINMEIQYSQTYSGVTFDVSNLNIVAVIPEDACKPNTLGAVGVTGYPSRIADRFVDNFQMNYWISNTSYAPGGTICEVQLRRDNTHNMMPWDPTNKGGQRVNITTSYYVLQ